MLTARSAIIGAAFMGLLAAACSSGSDAGASPPSPVAIASAMAAADGTRVTVSGGLVAPQGAAVKMCDAMTFSIPPQCVGGSLEVVGLDLATVPHTSVDAGVTWTNQVTVTGTMQGGTLTGATVVPGPASS